MRGRCWKFGADINTDLIIPGRYLNTRDPGELAKHCMEDCDPAFATRVRRGDIILADTNFGCGSSREHAPLAIKAAGVSCIIAKSFARIFYRNAFNLGMPVIVSPGILDASDQGDEIEVNSASGTILNISKGTTFQADPIPPFMQEIIKYGGLMEYVTRMKTQ